MPFSKPKSHFPLLTSSPFSLPRPSAIFSASFLSHPQYSQVQTFTHSHLSNRVDRQTVRDSALLFLLEGRIPVIPPFSFTIFPFPASSSSPSLVALAVATDRQNGKKIGTGGHFSLACPVSLVNEGVEPILETHRLPCLVGHSLVIADSLLIWSSNILARLVHAAYRLPLFLC